MQDDDDCDGGWGNGDGAVDFGYCGGGGDGCDDGVGDGVNFFLTEQNFYFDLSITSLSSYTNTW